MTAVANAVSVQFLDIKEPFQLLSGEVLRNLRIAYHTYGRLNATKDNVIWVFHALTANSNVEEWWPDLIGKGKLFDTDKYFIVCANNLGSCYGTQAEGIHQNMTAITIRDMTKAHQLLKRHLQIQKIGLAIGGSQGGQQALEWAITNPFDIQKLVLLACNAKHSAWGIAFNETQRMALELGEKGLDVARAIAMLSYRNYEMYSRTENQTSSSKQNAATYQRHQGKKLRKRFDAQSYWILSKAMDSHDVGKERGSLEKALQKVQAQTLVIGISSDILFPVQEQQFLAKHIPCSTLHIIDSAYGHDGFLTEHEQIIKICTDFLTTKTSA